MRQPFMAPESILRVWLVQTVSPTTLPCQSPTVSWMQTRRSRQVRRGVNPSDGNRMIRLHRWARWRSDCPGSRMNFAADPSQRRKKENRCCKDRDVVLFRALPSVGAWLSLVEHLPGGQGVAGSNPVAPTISSALFLRKKGFFFGSSSNCGKVDRTSSSG